MQDTLASPSPLSCHTNREKTKERIETTEIRTYVDARDNERHIGTVAVCLSSAVIVKMLNDGNVMR